MEGFYDFTFIPITIEGKTYNFIFDTGAETTFISKELAQKLGKKKLGKIKVTDSQQKTKKLNAYNIDKLSIGNVHYSDIGVIESDFSGTLFECMGIDGILGMNIIGLSNWYVNYQEQTVTICDCNYNFDTNKMKSIPIKFIKGRLYLTLQINQKKKDFLIDTGSNGKSIEISKEISISEKITEIIGYSSFGIHGETEFDTTKVGYGTIQDSIDVFHENTFLLQSNNTSEIVGNGFLKLKYEEIAFDFRNHKFYYLNRTTPPTYRITYPISPMMIKEHAIITSMNIDYKNLNIGDTIVAINGVTNENHHNCEMLNEFWKAKAEEHEKIEIQILKNGEIKKETIFGARLELK